MSMTAQVVEPARLPRFAPVTRVAFRAGRLWTTERLWAPISGQISAQPSCRPTATLRAETATTHRTLHPQSRPALGHVLPPPWTDTREPIPCAHR